MSPTEALLFWTALALYGAGWLLLVAGLVFRRAPGTRAGQWILGAALAAHTGSVLARWVATGHGPVMRDFENAVAGAWTLIAFSLALSIRRPAFKAVLAVTAPVAVVLLGYGLTQSPELEPLSPPYKTVWLYFHVIFAWISFAAFTLASSLAAVFLWRERGHRRAPPAADGAREDAARSLRSLDELQFRIITYGFVAAAAMIATGSIWARILWGSYWGWDPVETWSLASWLLYGLYIHLRVVFRWRMRKAAWFALFAVIPVLISFWGVGFLLTSRHLFAVMDLVNR